MDKPVTPAFCGCATLKSRLPADLQGRLSPKERMLQRLSTFHPVHQTEAGLMVALFHKTAYSTLTGEPIAYFDLRHQVTGIGRVSDRFIFAIRDGELTYVDHLSRRVLM